MTVRASYGGGDAPADLDALLNDGIRTIRAHGYTLQQIRHRVRERLEVEPPDHLLLVERDPGMRVVLQVELREAVACPLDWCTAGELADNPDRALGAIVLSPPAPLALVAPVLLAERPPLRLVYTSADGPVERVRRLEDPSSIAIASVSAFFLEMARGVLAPVVGDRHVLEEYLLVGDDPDLPGEADLIFCDSVTYGLLRPTHPRSEVIRHRVIAPACLEEVAAAVAEQMVGSADAG